MKTNFKYIHEYSSYDDAIDAGNNILIEAAAADYEYEKYKRKVMLDSYFEADSSSNKPKNDDETGFFAKVGNAVLTFVEKIKKFLMDLGDNIKKIFHKSRTDSEIVTSILTKYPQLADKVHTGLRNEWFTESDVAQFEKDVNGLMTMLDNAQIDNDTYVNKMEAAIKKFNDSAKPIADASKNVLDMVGFIPNMFDKITGDKASLKSMSDKFADVFGGNKRRAKYNKQSSEALSATTKAINTLMKSCNVSQSNINKITDEVEKFGNNLQSYVKNTLNVRVK